MGREEEKRISMEKKVEQMSETLAILMEKTSSHESRLAKAEQEIFPPGSNHSEATGKSLCSNTSAFEDELITWPLWNVGKGVNGRLFAHFPNDGHKVECQM